MGLAVGTGILKTSDSEGVKLVPEQQIKLAEALMFLIRRRAATDEYVPLLINMMIFGRASRIGDQSRKEEHEEYKTHSLSMQEETDNYFLRGTSDDDEILTMEEYWEDQDVRLRTGGPVFAVEEVDSVRAARVSVISELACSSHPSVLAPYASFLARLCIDSLRLEESRPVARAASMLARELYGVVLREQDEVREALAILHDGRTVPTNVSIPFTVALISSKESPEDFLLESVKNQVSSFAFNSGDYSNNERVYDPATAARCREAILQREEAEDGGILRAARLLVSNQELVESSSRLSALNIVERPTASLRFAAKGNRLIG